MDRGNRNPKGTMSHDPIRHYANSRQPIYGGGRGMHPTFKSRSKPVMRLKDGVPDRTFPCIMDASIAADVSRATLSKAIKQGSMVGEYLYKFA